MHTMSDNHQHRHPSSETDSLSSSSPMSSSGRKTFKRGSKHTGLLVKTASPPQSPSATRALHARNGTPPAGGSPRSSFYHAEGLSPQQKRNPILGRGSSGEFDGGRRGSTRSMYQSSLYHQRGSPRSSLHHQHGTVAAATSSPSQKPKPIYRRRSNDGLDLSSGRRGRRESAKKHPFTLHRPPILTYTLVFLIAFTLGNFWSSVSRHLAAQDAASAQSPLGVDPWDLWTESKEKTSAKRTQEIANMPKEDKLQPSTLEFMGQQKNWTDERIPPSNTTVVFMVMSARHNFDRRQAIRETWRDGHESNVYFLVSDTCWVLPQYRYPDDHACEGPMGHNSTFEQSLIEEQRILEQEQGEHRDLIFVPRKESYRSLVYKLKYAYKWAVDHVPKLKWVVKVDDDMVVRVQSMEFFLEENEPIRKPTVVGNIVLDSVVAREGKWAEFPSYVRYTYPAWPQGSFGHVVSYHIARFVASQIDDLVEYQGEDTTLGIWIHENKTMKESVQFIHSPRFHNEGKCFDASFLIVGHEISPDSMRSCYEELDEVITHESSLVRNMLKAAQEKADQMEWMDAKAASDEDEVVVIVFSERSSFLARQTIRGTWAATSNSSVFFVLASECDVPHYLRENDKCARNEVSPKSIEEDQSYSEGQREISRGVLYEQNLYRDMYVSGLPESHKEAEAYGLKAAYKWVVETVAPKARWIVKATDRMYVRLHELETMLAANHSTTDVDQPIIIGEIVNHSEVWKTGPWADPDYTHDFYPSWPKGSCGQVVSHPVARFVADNFDKLHHYQGSDTSLAIWLDDFNVTVDFRNDMDKFKNDDDCFQEGANMMGYQLPPEKLRECFDNDVATGLVVAPNKTSSDVTGVLTHSGEDGAQNQTKSNETKKHTTEEKVRTGDSGGNVAKE